MVINKLKLKDTMDSHSIKHLEEEAWKPPSSGYMKINIDRAFVVSKGRVGLRVIYKDIKERMPRERGETKTSISPQDVETQVTLLGPHMARDLSFKGLVWR